MDTNELDEKTPAGENLLMETADSQIELDSENAAVNDESDETVEENDSVSFEDLGLDEYTLKAVEKKGFVTPSPIQILAIPRLLNGDTNLIARARTGTGKTAAFGLPIIQNIRNKSDHVEALILEPTRELAIQTNTEMQSFANHDFPRTTVLYGGAPYSSQIRELKKGCEIVVGTPGRIKDHLEKGTLDLSKIKYFILDEGDEMLDMGFIDDIREIFQQANQEARILLFSATMPSEILKIAADFMGEYDIIEEEKVVDEALAIDQKYWIVKESEKIEALIRLIDMSPDFYGLVFTMTKMDADNVTRDLDMRGYEAAALHGDIMQNQREKVLERFRSRKTRILVATDVAARGIDISGLSHVVNYSLPFDAATYVHRIGRTGRAGKEGIAVTFVRPEERRKLGFMIKAVQRASKGELKEDKIPSVKEVLDIKEKRLLDELREKLFEEKTALVLENNDVKSAETLENTEENTLVDNQTESQTVENEVSETSVSDNQTEKTEESEGKDDSKVQLRTVPEKYMEIAKTMAEEADAVEILAGVLSIMYGEKLSPKHYGKISSRDYGPKGDQTRIFISLGKQDGYRAREIAQFFSELLHIPGRMVDDIDVAQQFSLVSLPVASAKKAIEMSKSNKKLPHMHIDNKEEGRGSRKTRSRDRDFGGREDSGKERSRGRKRDFKETDSEENSFDRPKGERFSKKHKEEKELNFHKGNEPRDFGGRNGGKRRGSEERRGSGNNREGRAKGSRPNVHAQTERSSSRKSGGAAAFVKKSGKAERF